MIITREDVEMTIEELELLNVNKIYRIGQVAKSLNADGAVLVENIDQEIADYLKDKDNENCAGEDTIWTQKNTPNQS